jgi:predicted Zn-dependent protease
MFYRAVLHDRHQNSSLPVTVRLEPGALFIDREIGPTLEWHTADIGQTRATDDGLVIVQNGHLFLEVEEPGFLQQLDRVLGGQKRFKQGFFDRNGMVGCLAILAVFIIPLALLYFLGLPWLSEKAVNSVSIEQEKSLSKPMYDALVREADVDFEKSKLLQAFYDSLNFDSRYHYELTVLKSPVMNAFAMPGGHIVVYDTLLNSMQKPEELAALLGHEGSHVDLKHSLRSLFRQLGSSLFFTFLLGDYGDISVIVARKADEINGLAYSRDMEMEADQRGADLMQKQAISLEGMRNLFLILKKGEGNHAQTSDFLSTHPSTEERLNYVEERINSPEHKSKPMRPGIMSIFEQLSEKAPKTAQ